MKKVIKTDCADSAIGYEQNTGCIFGKYDIYIHDDCHLSKSSFAHLYKSKSYGDVNDSDIFAGKGDWNWLTVKDYEVWQLKIEMETSEVFLFSCF